MNNLDITKVKDSMGVFYEKSFNSNIDKWDVSNVDDMSNMFDDCELNGDILKWNINPKCIMKNFGILGINSYEDFKKIKIEKGIRKN